MRKLLLVLAGSMLFAVPAHAQQAVDAAVGLREAVAPAPKLDAVPAAPAAPTLDPSRDEIRARVSANEAARSSAGGAINNERDFLYLVAAIIVGVVIAAVVLN